MSSLELIFNDLLGRINKMPVFCFGLVSNCLGHNLKKCVKPKEQLFYLNVYLQQLFQKHPCQEMC